MIFSQIINISENSDGITLSCFPDKYTMSDMNFSWHSPSLSLPSDFGDGYRLPKYVVSFTTEDKNQIIHYGEGMWIQRGYSSTTGNLMGSDDVVQHITGFVDFVHYPEFYITRKHNDSETGSVTG
jgi:hypothetical protein